MDDPEMLSSPCIHKVCFITIAFHEMLHRQAIIACRVHEYTCNSLAVVPFHNRHLLEDLLEHFPAVSYFSGPQLFSVLILNLHLMHHQVVSIQLIAFISLPPHIQIERGNFHHPTHL